MSAEAHLKTFQETLAFLAQTPQHVTTLIGGVSGDNARIRPADNTFSAVEQACHLRDIEQEGYLWRAKRMLAEDNPLLDDLDGAKLARERDYQSQDLAHALRAFASARRATLDILRDAAPEQMARRGRFGEAKEITLLELAGMMRTHDMEHLVELEALHKVLSTA
jgi:hypothetical protein